MTLAAEKQMEHVGETQAIANHDHDLIHDLNVRLDAVWRYDQYIANAKEAGKTDVQRFWKSVKKQDQENIDNLRQLIKDEVKSNCF